MATRSAAEGRQLVGLGRRTSRSCPAGHGRAGVLPGLPSYWNVVIGYLWLFQTPPAFNTALLLGLAVLVLAPVRFLYLTKLRRREDRRRHYIMGAVCVVALLLPPGSARTLVATVLLAHPAYYVWRSVRAHIGARVATRRG